MRILMKWLNEVSYKVDDDEKSLQERFSSLKLKTNFHFKKIPGVHIYHLCNLKHWNKANCLWWWRAFFLHKRNLNLKSFKNALWCSKLSQTSPKGRKKSFLNFAGFGVKISPINSELKCTIQKFIFSLAKIFNFNSSIWFFSLPNFIPRPISYLIFENKSKLRAIK